MKATRLPSGLHAGAESFACAVVNRRGLPPSVPTSHRFAVLLFLSMDHSFTTNTTVLPSGDRAGALSRFMAHKSREVMRRLSAADADRDASKARRRNVGRVFIARDKPYLFAPDCTLWVGGTIRCA